MQKIAKYISRSLLLIAGVMFLVDLFTNIPFSWMFIWLFLAPSLIIKEFVEMPEKGMSRTYSIIYIAAISLMWVAALELIIT
ncbi:hypothetical protein CEH05_18285 [Halobacillus halophilus]|uniref:Uncharacterized protein n=1 Tax=Halobacillus halophilus (strain ATCC 35676 / DSM 2266 / JCM 20832 / KCTC 3685 / LMG 17431 / NBRC 102448 / NCIMB 2269) TaxID=866895 RepID=I0JSE3_HALH3|nr:hypothetical protein [Halobacillus halophilus]ASF41001.1 hypothetical protein CEH05_18285 [Halobacillus halophilus]CCG47065.1 hypothetical protein HBHAL_4727 [Halobacillus halophilus DSM 2266]